MPRIRVTPASPQLDLFGSEPAPAVTAPLQASEPASEFAHLAPLWPPGPMRRVKKVPVPEALAPEPEPASLAKLNVVASLPDPGVGGKVEPFVTPEPPWSDFTKSRQLNADEATRAVQGRGLGYVGVRFHKTRTVVCRDCHEGLIRGTDRFIPPGFDGQGYQATIYTCEQRRPNVDSKCTLCGVLVIGEVAGG